MQDGSPLRPVQGPKNKFNKACEKEMIKYLEYCWEIGIPRTQDRFSHELVHFMEYNGIRNTFPKTQPGTYFFPLREKQSINLFRTYV